MVKNWQDRAAEFSQKRNFPHSPTVYVLDVLSELGEVAKEILLATNYGSQDAAMRPELSEELGDLLFSVCQLATAAEVDLEEAFTAVLHKYETRWQEKGHTGSETAAS